MKIYNDDQLSKPAPPTARLARNHQPHAVPEQALHPAVQQFALGLDGQRPDASTVATAQKLVQAARAQTVAREFSVDPDGALFLDLRLDHGILVFAELAANGSFHIRAYDDRTVALPFVPLTLSTANDGTITIATVGPGMAAITVPTTATEAPLLSALPEPNPSGTPEPMAATSRGTGAGRQPRAAAVPAQPDRDRVN